MKTLEQVITNVCFKTLTELPRNLHLWDNDNLIIMQESTIFVLIISPHMVKTIFFLRATSNRSILHARIFDQDLNPVTGGIWPDKFVAMGTHADINILSQNQCAEKYPSHIVRSTLKLLGSVLLPLLLQAPPGSSSHFVTALDTGGGAQPVPAISAMNHTEMGTFRGFKALKPKHRFRASNIPCLKRGSDLKEEKGERRIVVFHTAGISRNKQTECCQHMLLEYCRSSTSSHSPSLLPGKDPPGFGLCNLLMSCGSSQHRMQAQSQDPNVFSWHRLLLATIHFWH